MATRAPEPKPAVGAGGACWWVVHELHDPGAAWLTAALAACAAPWGVGVHAVPLPALLGRMRWQLRVETHGSRCTLQAPAIAVHAGVPATEAPAGTRLAGVVNRCGPVLLPPAVDDADYKSAEWSALLVAWLHGLPCPMVNRPSARQLNPAQAPVSVWRQVAAVAGLPIWPLPLQPAGAQPGAAPVSGPGLLVVGDRCFEAVADTPGDRPGWPAAAQRAAAAAAARQGCDLLAWTGARDAQGTWRIGGATPWPDLRPFGQAAIAAVAQRLAGLPVGTA